MVVPPLGTDKGLKGRWFKKSSDGRPGEVHSRTSVEEAPHAIKAGHETAYGVAVRGATTTSVSEIGRRFCGRNKWDFSGDGFAQGRHSGYAAARGHLEFAEDLAADRSFGETSRLSSAAGLSPMSVDDLTLAT
jgi:hypothetical protein